MALAKVDGILLNNESIRKEMLKRIYWKDKQYTDFGGGDYVQNVNIETKSVSPKGEGNDLFAYTYNTDSVLSRETLKRYLSNQVNHDFYEVKPISDGERFKWYGDYIEKFNPENTLKIVGDVKKAEGEKRVSFSNEKRFLAEKYLTPGLLNFYGNKLNADLNIAKNVILGNLDGFINVGEGRLADIAEANVKIIHDLDVFLEKPENYKGSGFKNLTKNINEAKKTNVNYKTPDEKYISSQYDDKNGKAVLDTKNKSEQTYKGNTYVTFNEGDYTKDQENVIEENSLTSSLSKTSIKTTSANGELFTTPNANNNGLLGKTAKLFNEHKIATMIGRFHTTINENGLTNQIETIDSAKSRFGNSKGRNLLKGGRLENINGYDNPYCRVWTYHHQYDRVSKLIRPFKEDINPRSYNPYEATYSNGTGGIDDSLNGRDYLKQHTVLDETGFVKIAPKKDGCSNVSSVKIKECMFSIENLAWKDVPRKGGEGMEGYYISDEQRGPNGGRIMWFPPYDLNFQESVSVNWNSNNFIGRGEPVFTYANTVRNGVLSFVVLVDHPSIIDNIGKNNLKEEQLSDDDILRFFAGCRISEGFSEEAECESEEVVAGNRKEDEEPKQQINKEKAKYVKFNVYFPNNYSGNGLVTPKNDWEENGSSDRLWYDYLLFGNETEIPETVPGNGYETVIGDNGISIDGSTVGINPVLKAEPWTPGIGIYNNAYYQYRVDFDSRQILKNKDLNGNTRLDFRTSNYTDSNSYGLNISLENQNSNATNTFSQIMLTMVDSKKVNFDEMLTQNIEALVDDGFKGSDDYNELVDLFKNGDKINKIKITGFASNQDKKNKNLLARRRCESLYGLIKQFVNKDAEIEKVVEDLPDLKNPTDNNTLEAKQQKYASCEIWFNTPEIVNISDTTEQIQNVKEERNDEGKQSQNSTFNATTGIKAPTRYETEAEYFKNLNVESPLIYKKLIDKFKYFNPAFHSISPEGFNARLTFLQQCTRQGHTIEYTSEDFAQTAGNLAFGRMPVCVLRLGDFINTKILINGMSFNYDANGPMQWDLNPEGIGVQPMYAKISLQITILGGQSLDGPINRLQNAVTFNYYANTGVYDNRSDRVSYGGENTNTENTNDLNNKSKEESGDKYMNNSENTNYNTTLTYRHVFTPTPNKKS